MTAFNFNTRIFRFSKIIFALLLILLLLPSCIPMVELNERGLIQSIGIDYDNDHFTISFQMFNSNSLSSSGSEQQSSQNTSTVITSKGKTIMDAMKKSCLKQERKIYYRVTDVIIIGKDVIKNKPIFQETINFLNKTYMSSPNIYIAMAEKKANYIISAEIKQSIMPSKFIQEMIKNAEKQSYIQKIFLSDIVTSLNSVDKSISIPIIKCLHNKDNKSELEILGIGVLYDGALKGTLPANQVKYIQLLHNKKFQISVNFTDVKYGRCDFNVISHNAKIKPHIINNHPHFTIDLDLVSNFIENTQGKSIQTLTEKEILYMEQLQQKTLKYRISKLLHHILKDHQTDLLYFTNDIYRINYQYWLKNRNHWNDVLKSTTFSLNIKNRICRSIIEKSKNY